MRLSSRGETSPLTYAAVAPLLLLSQHGAVAIAYAANRSPLQPDVTFWLLPLRWLSYLADLPPWQGALAFSFSLAVTWMLALLSLRRSAWSRRGYPFAAMVVIPGFQIVAIALLAVMPRADPEGGEPPEMGPRLPMCCTVFWPV